MPVKNAPSTGISPKRKGNSPMRPCEFSSVHSVPAEAFWRRRGIRSRATVWYGLMAAGHFSGRRGGEGGEAHFERRDVKHPRRAPPALRATRAARLLRRVS